MPDYRKMFEEAMKRTIGGAASAASEGARRGRRAAKKTTKKKTTKKKTVAKKVSTAVKSHASGVGGSVATQRNREIRRLQAELKKTPFPGKRRTELLKELRAIKNNKKRFYPSTPEARKNVGKKVEAARKKAAKKKTKKKTRKLPTFQGGGNL